MFEDFTISFIGAGMMAEAIIHGLIDREMLKPEQILASEPREERGHQLEERYGIRWTSDNVEAARQADLLVLSVKPQVFDHIIDELYGDVPSSALVLSIMAGVTIDKIARGLGIRRVVRAMPNTPARIGQGISVWTETSEVPAEQVNQARKILSALGEEVYVENEDYLDMATALSGTGPAYVFLFMEAMIDAGVHLGFSRRIAQQLVYQTVRGSVEFARMADEHPAAMRNQVTSPGGTSAEAIYHLEKGGLRTVMSRAIWAAYQRSVALGSGGKVSRLGGRDPEDLGDGR
jgi:pyrroline-5-carboxylate reductase